MSCRKPMFFTVVATLLLFSAQSHAAAYLGVVLGQRSDDAKGAVIAGVHDGSPAAKAKLAVGDVIVTVNDTNIKDASALVVKVRSLKAGDEVKFKIHRDGEEKTLTVKLGKRPESVPFSGRLLGGRSPSAQMLLESYFEKVLLEQNIATDADGINDYLSGLHPSEEQQLRAARLIEQLGAKDSYAKRDEAMAKLLVLPVLPAEALIAAAQCPDPEVRWRARTVLRLGKPESERVLYAVFKTIEETKLEGVVSELLRAIPLCYKRHLLGGAQQALTSAARPADQAELQTALNSKNAEVRIAASAALVAAIGEEAVPVLKTVLEDQDDRVKLAAARALANIGNRDALSALVKLLSSDDKTVQTTSAWTLRVLTGKGFGFAAYEAADKREAAIEKWKSWIAGEGKQAKLRFPLKPYEDTYEDTYEDNRRTFEALRGLQNIRGGRGGPSGIPGGGRFPGGAGGGRGRGGR